MSQKDPKNLTDEPENDALSAFAAELMMAAALAAHKMTQSPARPGRKHVSRKPSSARGRKGSPQGAGRIQAHHRGEVRRRVLHHQPGWQGGADFSGGGVAQDRGEAGAAVQLQSFEKTISEQSELLRPDGGDGRPGPGAAAADPAGSGAAEGRSGHLRQSDLSGSAQHGGLEAAR